MKPKIHPKFYQDAIVKCACGEIWSVGSTVKEVFVETCGKCHPFWTGEQRIVDTEGRVERFLRRYNMDAEQSTKVDSAKPAKDEETKQK